jgi:hypothetical protein
MNEYANLTIELNGEDATIPLRKVVYCKHCKHLMESTIANSQRIYRCGLFDHRIKQYSWCDYRKRREQ